MTTSFDLLGPLPTGTTVLEASAGTGKTFTIAGLVTRYLAEGQLSIEQLLVVTFGRAATGELRERVRSRLVSARDGLADPAAAAAGPDRLLAYLATGSAIEVAERRQRLVTALSSFDAATIVTTHQFCQQVLLSLGTAGDLDPDAVLVENLDDLVEEVVSDLYLRKWAVSGADEPTLAFKPALDLARAVVYDPQATLRPEPAADDSSPPAIRARFAHAVRDEFERRKRRQRVLGFDDLLSRLQATLADRDSGPAAVGRLRARYRVVLVDEFQDTDPVQWDILRRAFHHAATLVLVGDPKQAIYGFRGADVYAYLAAREDADHRATLDQNWRSDPGVLDGLAALFAGAELGDRRISVAPVSAATQGRSLSGSVEPMRLRLIDAEPAPVNEMRRQVTADVVAEVIDCLSAGLTFQPRDGRPARPVAPGDLAVIVRTGAQLELVHQALLAAGVPSVQRSTSSVFATPAAADWVLLLEALEQPHRLGRVRRLALSTFLGWDAHELQAQDLDRLAAQVRFWLQRYQERGIAALFETVSRDQRLAGRLLSLVDGERRLTDLRHVAEALHAAARSEQLGLTAALEWLRHRIADAAGDSAIERSRRLDSDDAAVQVVTVHMSKGLEFPIVYVPFGWDRFVFDAELPLFHEGNRRVRNVGGAGSPGLAEAQHQHNSEEFGEDLRLLYVALTRAQAQVTAWWAPSARTTRCSPLHRMLFGTPPALAESVPLPRSGAAVRQAEPRALAGAFSVAAVRPRSPARWSRPPVAGAQLGLARLTRQLDTGWRRTSYTALTATVHQRPPMLGSEPEVAAKQDEPPAFIEEAGPPPDAEPVPMAGLPGGPAFGTLVHAVAELTDPTAPDLAAELRRVVLDQLPRSGVALDPEALVEALRPVWRTPLGPLAGDRSLSDIATGDRLPELEFELPLRGGERSDGRSELRELAPLLRAHLPADDPLAVYADQLDEPELGARQLSGYLTGSIDAVLRVDGRYLVVDYKTNRLAEAEETLTSWHYRPAALRQAMLAAHYPLQALLYQVALHRYLRWRVPGYRPERDLGGVLYLFLRGMVGARSRRPDGSTSGVFDWQPPAELVVATSELLAHGSPPGADPHRRTRPGEPAGGVR